MLEGILKKVPIDEIQVKDRARQDYGDMDKLKSSFKSEGLINPIAIMEPNPDDPLDKRYYVLGGGRRYKAAKDLGWKTIDAKIFEYIADIRVRKTIELVENLIREDLTYAEEAKLIREAHFLQVDIKGEKYKSAPGGHGIRDTAEMLNISPAKVHKEIELANAIDKDPTLAKMKNKNEAISKLYKDKEMVLIQELAKRAGDKKSSVLSTSQQTIIDGYIINDVNRQLKKFDPKTFNFVEMDPPYGIELREIVITTDKQDELLKAKKMSPEDEAKFVVWLRELAKDTYRVMTDNSWLILWYAMEPWAEPTYQAFRAAGFEGTRVPMYWIKNNGNTRTPNIHARNYVEQFLYFRKGNAMLNKPGCKNIFTFPTPPDKDHPNEKPVEMYMDVINTFATPGSSCLSTFGGSGTFLLATANLKMPAVAIDLDEDNKKKFIAKVHRGTVGEFSSYR